MYSPNMIGPLFKQIYDALEKESNQLLRPNDLTLVQTHLLFILKDRDDGTCSLKELEKILHVAQSTTVGIVKRLEQKRLVESCGDVNDKRIKIAKITPAGLDACKHTHEGLQTVEQRLLTGLTEAEIAIFTELLQKVRKNFL